MQIDNAIVTPTNTHILDSCKVKSKEDIRQYLQAVRDEASPEMAICQRDLESMVREWRSHNLFYNFHVFRSRTKDVDLELKQPWWREWFCRLVSFFYFWD
jgi:Tfp pilus assembly protein PilP